MKHAPNHQQDSRPDAGVGWHRKVLILVATLVLMAAACGSDDGQPSGGEAAGDAGSESMSGGDSDPAAASQPQESAKLDSGGGDEVLGTEVLGTEVLDMIGYELVSTGERPFDDSGDAVCSVDTGQLVIEFYPDLGGEIFYTATAISFTGEDKTYTGAFQVDGADGTSVGSALIDIQTTPAEGGLIFVAGSITGAFAGGAGDGEINGSFGCLFDEAELPN